MNIKVLNTYVKSLYIATIEQLTCLSLLVYKKAPPLKRPRTEGLPDPRNCDSEEKAQLFQAANDHIDQITGQRPKKRRRTEYKNYDDKTRLEIAKSAINIGNSKTARKFSINESTVRSMKARYLRE